jgi:hypothetical protein
LTDLAGSLKGLEVMLRALSVWIVREKGANYCCTIIAFDAKAGIVKRTLRTCVQYFIKPYFRRETRMNKYVLMLAAAGLIAAAPAYYAFQAQAEEPATSAEADAAASGGTDATSSTEEMSPEAKDAAAGDSAAGETAPKATPVQGATE